MVEYIKIRNMYLQGENDKMEHKKRAAELFCKGYNCAQAVFAAFSDVTGMSESDALRLSSSFGGGMGRMREVCGACSAMFMVAGMLYGSDTTDNAARAEHYALIQSLAEQFKQRHTTIICRQLLASLKPADTPTPTERTSEFYKVRPCLKFVEDACDILDDMIAERSR